MNLFAPAEYWELTPEQKADICNGCGTKGLPGWFVPNTLWGLNIRPACDIHDFMYFDGESIEDKAKADRVFLNNMLRIVNAQSGAILRAVRRRRALKYYEAVHELGGPAFWSNKNTPEEMGHSAPLDYVFQDGNS